MSVQQITWAEIAAYNRETGSGLTIWEKRLIRRLDDAFEAARPGQVSKKPTTISETKASLRAAIAVRKAKGATSG